MEWTQENITRLISLLREKPILWDPTSTNYHDKYKKNVAWAEIGVDMQIDVTQVIKKTRTLIGQFHRELRRAKLCKDTGTLFKSKWYFFKALSFLNGRNESWHSTKAGVSQKQSSEQELFELTIEPKEDCDNSLVAENEEQTDLQMEERKIPVKLESNNMKVKRRTMVANTHATTPYLSDQTQRRDEFDVFGELVAHTLRSLNCRSTQCNVKYEIYNILHQAEMDNQQSNTPTLTAFSESSLATNFCNIAPSTSSQSIYTDDDDDDF